MRLVVTHVILLYLLCCVASIVHGAFGEESLESPQFCHKTIKDEPCLLDDCTRTSKDVCYHGDCSDTGDCVCLPCWRGSQCDEAVNEHAPVFTQTFYEEYISPDEPSAYPFIYIRASDKDKATCSASNTHHCPCSEVLYSLDDGADENGPQQQSTFVIDPKTGGISVAPGATLTPNTKHRLTAYARNPVADRKQETVLIVVIVSDVLLSEQTVKLRRLQTVPEISDLNENHTLDISFLPSSYDIGTLTIGSRVDCVLTIIIPESKSVSEINVEIFTDDENKTLSVLCPPIFSKGGELEISNVTQTSTQVGEENPFLLDTATFGFTSVTNLNTSISAQDSKIVITFSITVKKDQGVAVDERYWVSAGVEYSGESKLWIGQIGFLINQVPQYATDTNITVEGPSDFYKGEVDVFNVDLNVYRTLANLTVRATAGSSAKEYLLICELQLCDTGTGFCLDVSKDLAQFQVDMASQNVYESVFPFGNIINGGAANSTYESRISMDVVAFLRDGLATETSYDLTADATDGNKDATDSKQFTAKDARNYITPAKSLTMSTSIINGDDRLIPGECAQVRVAIELTSSTSVAPVSISLASQVTGTNFQINAVRINHVGNDISCLLQRRESIEAAVVYAAGPTATIDLKGIANTGGDATADGVNNIIGVDFIVKSAATDPGDDGNAHTFDVTVNYAGMTPLTSSLDVTTVTDPASITHPLVPEGDPVPFTSTLELLQPTDPSNIAPGEVVVLIIRPVFVRGTQYRYVATGLANTTGVTVVDMRVKSVGSHIASGLLAEPVAVYKPSVELADSADLDLGMVYNYARSGDSTEEDGLVIQLIVHATEQVPDSIVPVGVSISIGSNRLWVAEGSVTISRNVATEPVLPINYTLATAPTYSPVVTPGALTNLLHTIVIPANTSSKYVLNYTTTAPWLQITNVNLTSVGLNLACTNKHLLSPISGTSNTGTYILVDLGYVCNVPIGNVTDDENSVLEILLTVKTINSSDVEYGLTAVLAANLEISNALGATKTAKEELIFSVELPKTSFKLCCPESANAMRPGETEHCNVTITLLDNALHILMELETPFNGTATMTLNNVTVNAGGINMEFNEPQVVFKSSGNTSQNNIAKMDFGRMVNTGEHTEEAGNLVDGDNDVVIYIDVQMADNSEHNVNGSFQALEAGASVSGNAVVWVAYYKLAVMRDGTEKPSFNISFNHNGSSSTYSVGDKVWYEVDVSHATDSHATAVNVKGHVFLPPYIQFDGMQLNYDSGSKQLDFSQSNDNTGFYFTVPRMFFTDRVALTLETTIKSNYRYKLTKNWQGTTPIEVIFYMAKYDTNYYVDGQYFNEPMDYTTFDFIVPYPDIPGQTLLPTCGSPTSLGMGDGSIENCQITASFAPEPNAAAHHARLGGSSAWKTQARAGPFLYDRWIKIDLGKRAIITDVQTQGGSSVTADGDLGEFEILYSLDDTLYKAATPSDNKAFDHQKDAPASHDTIVSHTLLIPVEARYVIVNLTAYDYTSQTKWYNALRLEILGCEIPASTATDTCPPSAIPLISQPYQRGFLADVSSDTLFVCDTITHGKSGVRKEIQASVYAFIWKKPDMQCFMMIYAEKQWTGLDPLLRHVVGFLPSTGKLYGIMGNSPDSYVASEPPYISWYLIERTSYDEAAASDGFVGSIAVPFVSKVGFSYSDPDNHASSEYAIGDWKATMSGIFKGSEQVLDWNECCQPTCSASGGLDNCS